MKANSTKIILAIETSCDETAASVLRGDIKSKNPNFEFLSSVVKSQIEIHKKSGGVIPEVAARNHVKNILPVVSTALKQAKLKLENIDYIAVTSGPGLVVSLIVGVEFAKGLSLAANKQMIPTNHMEGHLYSAFGGASRKDKVERIKSVQFPILAMIVSGGHTMLVVMKDYKHYKVIGSTVDDAAGEAFDKVAKLLGLPYPGGPEISKLAEKATLTPPPAGGRRIEFPRPMIYHKNYDFSFSGLKTSVRNFISNHPKTKKADIARAFEDAVVDVLVKKAMRAVDEHKCKTVSLSGGVAANKKLRTTLAKNCKLKTINFIVPDFELCTDNAQMIALAAYFNLRNGYKPVNYNKVKADPSWEIE